MATRVLVMGDNHGDTESLRRVLDDVDDRDERIDLAVHVGDFTRAMREARQRDDEQRGKELGVEQLESVEPLLEDLDALADHGLLWVWGNQDYFGDLDHDLDVGTEIPADGHVEAAGLRFTSGLDRVEPDSVLVTHMEYWRLADHFDGLAHVCGNTHRGRRKDRRLNSSFLKLPHPETGEPAYGGYFVVEMEDGPPADAPLDVEMRPIGDLERVACDRHRERGVQFQPSWRGCMFCEDERILLREMAASAFYGVAGEVDGRCDPDDETVADEALVAHAAGLWEDPPAGFREDFAAYLEDVDDDRYAPLTRAGDGRLALAETSYAY